MSIKLISDDSTNVNPSASPSSQLNCEPSDGNKVYLLRWRIGFFFGYLWTYKLFRTITWWAFWIGIIITLKLTGDAYLVYRDSENFKMEEASIGPSASFAGSLLVGAKRKCRIIGIEDIRSCATNNGLLLQDRSAKGVAQVAVNQFDEYTEKCKRHYTEKYCIDLLQRAFNISWDNPN